ncbi:hypothetical protein BASA61_004736 [Batrachochytrium salamandrivorans]|nr:hypothetical protein BASA61_004736 [Batrachochytrium salamandrivorans]
MATETVSVGFQGQPGAYSETVALNLFHGQPELKEKTLSTTGYTSFEKVFEAVAAAEVQFGIVPIENSVTGIFYKVLDLLQQHSLHIVGETTRHEQHSLVALPGVSLSDITQVHSHTFAIDQCSIFLATLDPKVSVVQTVDTAASAQSIKTNDLRNVAAITGMRAAELYGMTALQRGIEDDPNNVTRYVLVALEPVVPQRHTDPKTSISVVLKNQTGAMVKALSCFSLRDVNVCKIESRPSSRSIRLTKPWEYVMYIDVDGSITDPSITNAVRHLQEFSKIRILGSYPRYSQPSQPWPRNIWNWNVNPVSSPI